MMKFLSKALLLPLILTLVFGASVFSKTDAGSNYWPNKTWRTSTPEAQGMDSGKIYEMLRFVKDNSNMHSMLIIRNGYLVTEAYFAPYHRDVRQNIYSCSKSFTSALIGIAIQQGSIKDIQRKVVELFPGYTIDNLDDRKKVITIENLLTMTNGLQWQGGAEDDYRMIIARDSVQYILNRPMVTTPGTSFNYCSGGSHLLSTIIQQAYGINTWYFKTKYLFNPIGIENPEWECDSQGINWGNMNLYLTPMEMARFGYLYLRNGVWKGKQIVPAEWVAASTKEHISFPADPTNTGSYGYHWWITPYGYCAIGHGGQFIFVIPKLNMVVVMTSGIPMKFDTLVEKYVIPAVKSDKPLPPNKEIATKMKDFLRKIEFPASQPVPPLPAIVAKISRKVIQCEKNDARWKSVTLRFEQANGCYFTINWDYGSSTGEIPVSLNGVYRTSIDPVISSRQVAFKGAWVSDNIFLLNDQELREAERYDIKFTFNQDEVSVDISGPILGHYTTFKGKLQE